MEFTLLSVGLLQTPREHHVQGPHLMPTGPTGWDGGPGVWDQATIWNVLPPPLLLFLNGRNTGTPQMSVQ